jgi:hypothetical protein
MNIPGLNSRADSFSFQGFISYPKSSWLVSHVTPATEPERAQVKALPRAEQAVAHNSVEAAFVDQTDKDHAPRDEANQAGIKLIVVNLPKDKKGFVLLPGCWVVERSFGWTARFRRLARDFERLLENCCTRH